MSALEPMHVLAARSFAHTKLPNNASMYFPVEKGKYFICFPAWTHSPMAFNSLIWQTKVIKIPEHMPIFSLQSVLFGGHLLRKLLLLMCLFSPWYYSVNAQTSSTHNRDFFSASQCQVIDRISQKNCLLVGRIRTISFWTSLNEQGTFSWSSSPLLEDREGLLSRQKMSMPFHAFIWYQCISWEN